MCNAHNHQPACSCGWGGGFYSGGQSHGNSVVTWGWIDDYYTENVTFETYCFWCNEVVFFHRNANGGCVLFDSLGQPWQVHSCWEENKKCQTYASKRICDNQAHPKISKYKFGKLTYNIETIKGYIYSTGKALWSKYNNDYFVVTYIKSNENKLYRVIILSEVIEKLKPYSSIMITGKVEKSEGKRFIVPGTIRASSSTDSVIIDEGDYSGSYFYLQKLS